MGLAEVWGGLAWAALVLVASWDFVMASYSLAVTQGSLMRIRSRRSWLTWPVITRRLLRLLQLSEANAFVSPGSKDFEQSRGGLPVCGQPPSSVQSIRIDNSTASYVDLAADD